MSETTHQDPLDKQRLLLLLDKQVEYYRQLRQSGMIDKAFELLESQHETPESGDPFIDRLADQLEPFMNELKQEVPAEAILQVVPLLDATVERDGYEAAGLSFRWRKYMSECENPQLEEHFIGVYKLSEHGSYELEGNFTIEEALLIRKMLKELGQAREKEELADLDESLSFIGDDMWGHNFGNS